MRSLSPSLRRPSRAGRAAGLLFSLTIGGAGTVLFPVLVSPASAQSVTASAHPYAVHVDEAAQRFGIPEAWIWAVMRVESGGDPSAVSSAGAMGLMQIMPATWATLTTRHVLGSDPHDVRANILGGAAYLREMHDRYRDLPTALAAYNAGPGRVDDWRSHGRPLPRETIAYVARIAPIIGSSTIAAPAVLPAADPYAWRRAALFAVQSTAPAKQASGTEMADAAIGLDAGPALPSAPSAPARNPLFAPVSGGGAP